MIQLQKMADLLSWTEYRPIVNDSGRFVAVGKSAIFSEDARLFKATKSWLAAYTALESQDFLAASKEFLCLAEFQFKWIDCLFKDPFPVAFHEHALWLAGNLCLCISHFKHIEKVDDAANRAGLFRSLQTLASRTSPYGGFKTEVEEALNIVQRRAEEEAAAASAHWHLAARRVREAVTVLETVPDSKRKAILMHTIRAYNKNVLPQADIFTVQLLAPAIEIPRVME